MEILLLDYPNIYKHDHEQILYSSFSCSLGP